MLFGTAGAGLVCEEHRCFHCHHWGHQARAGQRLLFNRSKTKWTPMIPFHMHSHLPLCTDAAEHNAKVLILQALRYAIDKACQVSRLMVCLPLCRLQTILEHWLCCPSSLLKSWRKLKQLWKPSQKPQLLTAEEVVKNLGKLGKP